LLPEAAMPRFLLVVWLVAFGASSARAQSTLRLSESDAVARALERAPLVVRSDRERDVVAAGKVGAGVLLPANPAVVVTGGHRRDNSGSIPPAQGPEWSVQLQQTVEIAGQRGARLREADRAIAVASERQRLARIETRAEARTAYVLLQVARAQAEAAKKRVELGDQLLTAARARVRAGAASDVELHLAEVERARFEHDRIDAELAAAEAERALKRLVGAAANEHVEPATPLALPAPVQGDAAALVAAAVERRAERRVVGAARAHVDAATTRLKREIAPNPTLFVDVAEQQPGQLYIGGGVALPLPLWRRNQGELAQARAERRRLEDEDRLLVREIELEVSSALRTLETRQAEATLWSERVVPAAEANVELVRQGWLGGKFDLFRVVQVTREAADARRRQLEVLGDLWRARIELDRATGDSSS
jgi:outer membrane protein, heavy metal efflux system